MDKMHNRNGAEFRMRGFTLPGRVVIVMTWRLPDPRGAPRRYPGEQGEYVDSGNR